MFPRIFSLINTLIPDRVRHRWNLSKALSAAAAIMVVMVLMPVPQNLVSLFASVPGGVHAGDIVVEGSGDAASGIDTNCVVEGEGTTNNVTNGFTCRLRDALALANKIATDDSVRSRIVFDSSVNEVILGRSLDILGPIGVDINGSFISGHPQVTVHPASSGFDSDFFSYCDEPSAAPSLINIFSPNTRVAGLSIVGSPGNGIQIIGDSSQVLPTLTYDPPHDVTIENNFIGTDSRTNVDIIERNQGHGICVFASDQSVGLTHIQGNVIVNNGLDGIRMQGTYDDTLENGMAMPVLFHINNNLIGNLTGNDSNPVTGNRYSGITVKNSVLMKPPSTIDHNIITNNGFGDDTHFVGDGITLLNAWGIDIASNYLGTTQTFAGLSAFPFPVNSSGSINIPTQLGASHYNAAPNACDGIGIRFYDHIDLKEGDTIDCVDPDQDAATASGGVMSRTYTNASLVGPSNFNHIYDNEIGSNNRNGIYIQSVACHINQDDTNAVRTNLPNKITGTGSEMYPVQSTNNSILQNSIFTNDNSREIVSGSGSYGIGIDLEDFATANLDEFSASTSTNTYWGTLFPGTYADNFVCGSTIPDWEPAAQNTQTAVDTNITENDSYPTAVDAGFDPDAGANRLINTPVIDMENSTPTNITGSGAEGTVVELFQVLCHDGGDGIGAYLPTGQPQSSLSNCDTDFWNESTTSDNAARFHDLGHGQGYRFLGSAYIPVITGGNHQGTWSINPSTFSAGGADYGVAPFTGGLVTATSTSFGAKTLCWDDAAASACSPVLGGVAPASVDFDAQRISNTATGTGGVWNPANLPTDDCLGLTPPSSATFYADTTDGRSWFDCAGSTSEFSANAIIQPASSYSLTKTANPAVITQSGSTVYTITATNRSDASILFGTGSLTDVLPANVDLASCTYVITGGGSRPCAGSGSNILGGTDFGALHVTGDTLVISVGVNMHDNLSGAQCTIVNTVGTGATLRDLFDRIPAETGSNASNHQAIVTISNCAGATQPHFTNIEKLVSASGSDFFPADVGGTPLDAARGDAVSYLFHVSNLSGQSVTGSLTDNFPSTLVQGTRTVTCWINTNPNDNSLAGDTPIAGCSHDLASGRFDSSSATGIQDFTVPTNQYLHILVTGYSINATQALNSAAICNRLTTISGGVTAQDDACLRVIDPGLAIYKSVVLNGTESSFDIVTGAPGVLPATSLTYYIDVGNTSSNATLNGLSVVDTFPTGLASTTGSPWTCSYFTPAAGALINHSGPYVGTCAVTPSTGAITGVPTQLLANQMLHIRLTGRSVPNITTTTTYCNSATATTGITNLTATDNACFLAGAAGLDIVKTASPASPAPGSVVTYTLNVSNPGATTLTNVTVTDDLDNTALSNNLLPACITGINQVTALDSGVINTTTNAITWTIPSLNPGLSQAVRFTATINPLLTAATNCHNTAVVAAGSQVASDQSSVDITVPAVSGNSIITLDKTALNANEDTIFTPGDTVRYRVTLNNTGNIQASGLSIRDVIPTAESNLSNVNATAGTVNSTRLSAGELLVDNIAIARQSSQSVSYDTKLVDDSRFPLNNYRLHRNADRTDDDFYPAKVRSASVESDSEHSDADDALSAPDQNFVSLGQRGQVTFAVARSQTAEKLVVDGDGDDFCVLEVDPSALDDSATEQYTVEVSQTTRSSDFERVGRITKNSNCFDIEDANMTWARYIRIKDMSSTVSGPTPGVDIDAVCLLHLGGFVTNTAEVLNGASVLGSDDQTILVDFTDAFDDAPTDRDCREQRTVTSAIVNPLPLPPPPAPVVPLFPSLPLPPIQLPKTGSETLPFLGTGMVMSIAGWIARKRRS